MTLTVLKHAAFKVRSVNHGTKKTDKNRYCGPAVLSIMSGITTGEASRLIRNLFPYVHAVRGTSTHQVSEAFQNLGIRMSRVSYRTSNSSKPTLTGWLRQTVEERTAGRVFLVVAGNHWQIITGRRYICGISGELVSIKSKIVKRRARVTEVHELRPIANDGKIRINLDLITKPQSKKRNNCYNRVRKLISDNPDVGLSYEIERHYDETNYWVSSGLDDLIYEIVEDVDHSAHGDAGANNDGRFCHDWSDVEQCMANLIEFHEKWGHLKK